MRICHFEDQFVSQLEPLTLTRPVFDLRCGRYLLGHRQARVFDAAASGALVRPHLAELCRYLHPEMAVNDLAWLESGPVVLVNARWLPDSAAAGHLDTARLAFVGSQLAYAVLRPRDLIDLAPATLEDCIDTWRRELPHAEAGGWMIDYPWDLVEHNAATLTRDFLGRSSKQDGTAKPDGLTLIGPADRLVIDPSARVEPFVVADTTHGPVMIDRDAIVQSFSRIEGPCYIGPGSWVVGAKIKGSSVGPICRVGGEVEATILHGYANKYHDGFLGHSYVGEWVNLAAGTITSDLRNDYGEVTMPVGGHRVATGLTKIGSFFGDHSKTGLGVLMNTGTLVGAFCNLLPTGTYSPRVIPSFCTVRRGQLQEGADPDRLMTTAATVMRRRDCELSDVHTAFFRDLYARTAPERRATLNGHEPLRVRA